MAEFKTPTPEEREAAASKGAARLKQPRAVRARFNRRTGRITVTLNTGLEFSFEAQEAPVLAQATADQIAGVKVDGLGFGLHFPALDADVSIPRLLERHLGESNWQRQERRALASRANGAKGGRPKKEAEAQPKRPFVI